MIFNDNVDIFKLQISNQIEDAVVELRLAMEKLCQLQDDHNKHFPDMFDHPAVFMMRNILYSADWFIESNDDFKSYFAVFCEESKRSLWESETAYSIHSKQREFRNKAESPIELIFLDEMFLEGIYCNTNLEMYAQYTKESPFRFDVAFPQLQIAVELDGHAYHSSKEDRKRDASKDREMMRRGWKVIRFTGSEVFQNVRDCVRETQKIISIVAHEKGLAHLDPFSWFSEEITQ